jgi:hypothetical protein
MNLEPDWGRSRRPLSKLTADQVRAIRASTHREDFANAVKYGMTPGSITNIRLRKRRRDVV